jgi:hypothetical protein
MWKMRANQLNDRCGVMAKGFTIGIVCVLIASCGLMGWGKSLEQEADEQNTGDVLEEDLYLGEADSEEDMSLDEIDISSDDEIGSGLITGPGESCPDYSRYYNLWYDHTCVLKMSTASEELYLEETSDFKPFVLLIKDDGEVEAELDQEISLTMSGRLNSNNSSCPITNYKGIYSIRAEISGSCQNEAVYLHVKLERFNFNLTGDCQLSSGFALPRPSSAPEIDHVFVHRESGDAYVLNVPEGGALADIPGVLNCTYIFVLQPAGLDEPDLEELELVPLVPIEE